MFGIERLTDAVDELTLQIAALRVDLRTFAPRQPAKEQPSDPATELLNRRFSEGLDNLLSFDGRPAVRSDKDEG